MTTDKIREDRQRRRLAKAGLTLNKTPSRSYLRECYGPGYMIVDAMRNFVVDGCGARPYTMTLDDVESFTVK